jgi:hypothetical protein
LRARRADRAELRGGECRSCKPKKIAPAMVDVLGHVDLLDFIVPAARVPLAAGSATTIVPSCGTRFQNGWIYASERHDFCGIGASSRRLCAAGVAK